jgi:hypothetical protein
MDIMTLIHRTQRIHELNSELARHDRSLLRGGGPKSVTAHIRAIF